MGASCVLLGTAFGTGLTLAVFLKPLPEEFGWSRGATSLAYSTFVLLSLSRATQVVPCTCRPGRLSKPPRSIQCA